MDDSAVEWKTQKLPAVNVRMVNRNYSTRTTKKK